MSANDVIIETCPLELRAAAAALVLCDLAPSQRGEIAGPLLHEPVGAQCEAARGLFVALCDGQLRGAAWGQLQPGSTAVFWPPRTIAAAAADTSARLAQAVLKTLDDSGVAMIQVLLPAADAPDAALLQACGFRYLTDLVYLNCERDQFTAGSLASADLEFAPYNESQRGRMSKLIEETYEGTLDCAELGGERDIDDVIDGYRATGEFSPSIWFFVRARDVANDGRADVGVLLLADHPAARHVELVYMGLVPAARGRGWGRQIVHHAQRIANCMDRDRIVLAVDAANEPARAVYREAHFEAWDRRSVFLRFLGGRAPAPTRTA